MSATPRAPLASRAGPPHLSAVAAPQAQTLAQRGLVDTLALAVVPADGTGACLSTGSQALAARLGVDVSVHLTQATGRVGEVVAVPLAGSGPSLVVLVGVGDESVTALRRAGAALARRCAGRARVLCTLVARSAAEAVRSFAEGYGLGAYTVPRRSGTARDAVVTSAVQVVVRRPDAGQAALWRAAVTVAAVWLARDLANTPADEKSPEWLADQALSACLPAGCGQAAVWDEPALRAGGFEGILGVGSGSRRPPRLVEVGYRPSGRGRVPHVVLVGKGITFDSGGISIKPAAGMELMKTDMAGAAAVIGVMSALRDLDVRVRVTALLALAENLPGDSAMRPSDVLVPYGGRRSVEVVNTDAEGRLVLADALAYADAGLDPDVVVDIATLTGAATMGLGRRHAPVYATDERLAAALLAAAEASGERLWPMPLVEDYRAALDSPVADLRNAVTDPSVGGGSITAALFLREFAGPRAWAHLDIAGTGRAEADEHEVAKGATGFGVRLLLRYLEGLGPPAQSGPRR